MLALLLAAVVVAQAAPPSGPAAAPQSKLRDQGAVRTLDLRLGERVVLTFDAAFKPVLRSATLANPAATIARLPFTVDLQAPETRTGTQVETHPVNGNDTEGPEPGTVVMTLIPYQAGTLLLVENGLPTSLRYHAATMRPMEGGGARGFSTSLCPARPGVRTTETWADRFQSLLIVKFEPTAASDTVCRM